MGDTKEMNWSDIEVEIKNVIPQDLIGRLKSIYENRTEDDSDNKQKFIVSEKDVNSFVYAVFKDHVCFGKFVNMKFCDKFKNDNEFTQNDTNNLLELRVFNRCFEVRVIYSFEQDKFLYRYLDDYNESKKLYIYKEEHYLDGEWQKDGKFKSKIRNLPELPFNTETYKDQDLKLLIKSYIKFNDDGSPEVADWRLAGFKAGGNEVECDG